MKITLITPVSYSVDINTGCHFITAGIKYILDRAFGKNHYYSVSLNKDNPSQWKILNHEDLVVICGNPRFNVSHSFTYTDGGIWKHLLNANSPVIDAWNGSACPYPVNTIHESVKILERIPKTKKLISYAATTKLNIVRDEPLFQLLSRHGIPCHFLHCCSWYAKDYYNVESNPNKNINVIAIRRMPGYEWMIDRFNHLKSILEPCIILCTNTPDYMWIKKNRPNVECEFISDPKEILELLAVTKKLLSIRVHITIPALSLGAEVCNIYQDSRFYTCGKFGIRNYPFMFLERTSYEPVFHTATSTPDLREIVNLFQTTMAS